MTGAVRRKLPRRFLWVGAILFLVLSNSTLQASASMKVEILSHTGYRDSIGFYHVVGEVQNTGNVDVFVQATATFYDSANTAISSSTSPTTINVLMAGRRAPFEISLLNAQQSAIVYHYGLEVVLSSYPSMFPLGLEILSDSSFEISGWMHVTGTIKNSAPGQASSVKVVATYYDTNHNIVATRFSATNPTDIRPGEQGTFDIVLSPDRAPFVASYALTAESAGYGLISRTPFNSVLSLEAPSTTVGVPAKLTATLRDENREPIANAPIDFHIYADSSWGRIGSSITNGDGRASVTYRPTVVGRFPVKAIYNGSTSNSASVDIVELVVGSELSYAPVASIAISPPSGGVSTIFTLDASSSSDVEDPVTALEVRWDWDGDGTWDSSWSREKTVQHQFDKPGSYNVRVEVRDTSGLITVAAKQVIVVPGQAGSSILTRDGYLVIFVSTLAVAGVGILYTAMRKKRPQQSSASTKSVSGVG